MKLNRMMETNSNESLEKMLDKAENKSAAILQVIEKKNADLIQELTDAQVSAAVDNTFYERNGYRTQFSAKEKQFYEAVVNQSFTADQVDIIPTTIIDRTMADIKAETNTMSLINFAPAGVTKWLTGSAEGSAVWGNLTAALARVNDISACINGLRLDANKLYALMIIPKAIRELELPFVDKYFTAKLNEVMRDGIISGYLTGNGVNAPIGIFNKRPDSTGQIAAKTVSTTLTSFSLENMAEAKIMLCNGGRRVLDKLYLICNPTDKYQYIDPAIKFFNGETYVQVTDIPVEVIAEPNCPSGKAALTLSGVYTMGFSGVKIEEYKETLALEDADLIIGKVLGNGAPDDDNTAFVFDPSKLQKFVPEFRDLAAVTE